MDLLSSHASPPKWSFLLSFVRKSEALNERVQKKFKKDRDDKSKKPV